MSFPPSQSLLSDQAILSHLQKGTVVIDPFVKENLSTSSYDVTLGKYYFREHSPDYGIGVYNPCIYNHGLCVVFRFGKGGCTCVG